MLHHKERYFKEEPFPYVKQTDIRWRITDPFPNEGVLTRSFPPEVELADSYLYQCNEYKVRDAVGRLHIRCATCGTSCLPFTRSQRRTTPPTPTPGYGRPKKQEVGLWVTTQDYSRSESDLPPPPG